MAIIDQAWDKLNDINSKILQLKQLKQEVNQLQIHDLNITILLKEVIDHCFPLQEDNHRIQFHYDHGINSVAADDKYLRQIFQELLTNAQKFAVADSSIVVTLEQCEQISMQVKKILNALLVIRLWPWMTKISNIYLILFIGSNG
ncbi:hypothetical protein NON20_05985 [Synechocystis sp. B12]|nr:hypothetical protein NON20_05985 [Synechocystis sp. B12]